MFWLHISLSFPFVHPSRWFISCPFTLFQLRQIHNNQTIIRKPTTYLLVVNGYCLVVCFIYGLYQVMETWVPAEIFSSKFRPQPLFTKLLLLHSGLNILCFYCVWCSCIFFTNQSAIVSVITLCSATENDFKITSTWSLRLVPVGNCAYHKMRTCFKWLPHHCVFHKGTMNWWSPW